MLDEAYRKEMDQMGPNSEQMDRLMAAMAAKGRRPRPLRRTVVLAAAVCAALVMTSVRALTASLVWASVSEACLATALMSSDLVMGSPQMDCVRFPASCRFPTQGH